MTTWGLNSAPPLLKHLLLTLSPSLWKTRWKRAIKAVGRVNREPVASQPQAGDLGSSPGPTHQHSSVHNTDGLEVYLLLIQLKTAGAS